MYSCKPKKKQKAKLNGFIFQTDAVPSIFPWTEGWLSAVKAAKEWRGKDGMEDEMEVEAIQTSNATAEISSESIGEEILTPTKQAPDTWKSPHLRAKRLQRRPGFLPASILEDAKSLQRYTGVPSIKVFHALLKYFRPAIKKTPHKSYEYGGKIQPNPSTPTKKRGKRVMATEEEFLFVLIRLRCDLPNHILCDLFVISNRTGFRIFRTWVIMMSKMLRCLPIWRTAKSVRETLPEKFRPYPNCRVIIDCTEVELERSKAVDLQKQTFSNYKQRNTVKALVGISPDGQLTFVSNLYTGSTSDKKIVNHCGILDQMENGDAIMVDRGFTILQECETRGIELIIPEFLSSNAQFTPEQIAKSRLIAKLRVLVETRIGAIKKFKILQHKFSLKQHPLVEHIWSTCSYLVNFFDKCTAETDNSSSVKSPAHPESPAESPFHLQSPTHSPLYPQSPAHSPLHLQSPAHSPLYPHSPVECLESCQVIPTPLSCGLENYSNISISYFISYLLNSFDQ